MSVPSRPQRPKTVTFLIVGVFLLGTWNAGRTLAIAQESRLLLALTVTPDPRIRIGMAVVWTGIFWGLAAAMWWRRPFSRKGTPILLTIYAIVDLLLPVFFTQGLFNRQAWLVTAVIYVLAITFAYWILHRPATKSYFGAMKNA